MAGAASGNGIYSDQGLAGGRILSNLFERNANTGMVIADTAVVVDDLVVSSNRGVDNGSFAVFFHGTNIEVSLNTTGDTVSADDNVQGTTIYVGGNTAGVMVTDNIARRPTAAAMPPRTACCSRPLPEHSGRAET
ncbi:MAG: hypothetical protein ACRDPR_01590 [Nocardioidaceae bacterium]